MQLKFMSIFETEQSSMIICSIKSDKNNVHNNTCRCSVFFFKTRDIDSLIQFKIKIKKRHKHIQQQKYKFTPKMVVRQIMLCKLTNLPFCNISLHYITFRTAVFLLLRFSKIYMKQKKNSKIYFYVTERSARYYIVVCSKILRLLTGLIKKGHC